MSVERCSTSSTRANSLTVLNIAKESIDIASYTDMIECELREKDV